MKSNTVERLLFYLENASRRCKYIGDTATLKGTKGRTFKDDEHGVIYHPDNKKIFKSDSNENIELKFFRVWEKNLKIKQI